MEDIGSTGFTAALLVELANAISWPVTVITLAFMFRNKLSSALGCFLERNNVTEVSTPAFTAKFAQSSVPIELHSESRATEVTGDYESVVKFQSENESKYTKLLLKNYQLHRKSYGLSDAEALEMTERALAISIAQNWYANINRIIYASQLEYLDYLYTSEAQKASKASFVSYFLSIQSQNQALANMTHEQYISFLIGQGLVQVSGENYQLTDWGESYVEYMKKYPNLKGALIQC